jgi:hypothetical protein
VVGDASFLPHAGDIHIRHRPATRRFSTTGDIRVEEGPDPVIIETTDAVIRLSANAPELVLSPETLATLDDILPGPGGEALQAYAW